MIDQQPNKGLRTLLILQIITLIALALALIWYLIPLIAGPISGGGNYEIVPKGYSQPPQAPLSWQAPTTLFASTIIFNI